MQWGLSTIQDYFWDIMSALKLYFESLADSITVQHGQTWSLLIVHILECLIKTDYWFPQLYSSCFGNAVHSPKQMEDNLWLHHSGS